MSANFILAGKAKKYRVFIWKCGCVYQRSDGKLRTCVFVGLWRKNAHAYRDSQASEQHLAPSDRTHIVAVQSVEAIPACGFEKVVGFVMLIFSRNGG